MTDTGQHGPRLAHQHFEVLRGHAVGEGDGGVHVRHEDIVRKSLADWSAVVLVPDMDAALAIANSVAPEHLEVLMREPWSVLPLSLIHI